MTKILQDQEFISAQQPMPVDDMSVSSSVQSITGETVSLYYSNAGVRTIDAGQAAGTAVMGQLTNKNILDANGGYIATYADSSLSFTGNCFTTQVKFPSVTYKSFKDSSWATKLATIASFLENGEYCVDYLAGTIYGKKATTTSSLTSTSYKINQSQVGSGSSASGQTANSTTVTGFANNLPMARYNASPTARTEGQFGNLQASANGGLNVNLESLISGEAQSDNVMMVVQKPLSVSTYTPVRDSSTALEASSISKASAGNFYHAFGAIDKGAATGLYYVQFLDSATLTADGAVTHLISPIAVNHTNGTDSYWTTEWFAFGVAAANGIVIVLSTSMVTKTIVTGGNVALFATTFTK